MKQPVPQKVDDQFVYLDPFLVDRARINAGLSRKELANQAQVAVNTVLDLFKNAASNRPGNGRLQAGTARLIAKTLEQEVVDLLAPWDPRYLAPSNPGPLGGVTEWEAIGYLEQGRLAPNGLYYIVCQMQHRHLKGRLGRGKFYHLSWLPTAVRDTMRHKLSRHAETCVRVGLHPHLASNLSSSPVGTGDGWWVVDEWTGEKCLADSLQEGPWPLEKLPRLLAEIALGLQALHQADILLRELSPERILIADKDGRAVLSDFELAKLLDGSPSVSSEWPEDMFRAPEVDGGTATVQSDLYSLGQIALAAVGGSPEQPGEAAAIWAERGVPKRLAKLLSDCVQAIPSKRPTTLEPLLTELTRWREKSK